MSIKRTFVGWRRIWESKELFLDQQIDKISVDVRNGATREDLLAIRRILIDSSPVGKLEMRDAALREYVDIGAGRKRQMRDCQRKGVKAKAPERDKKRARWTQEAQRIHAERARPIGQRELARLVAKKTGDKEGTIRAFLFPKKVVAKSPHS